MYYKSLKLAGAMALLTSPAFAGCGISEGNISILSNDFAAVNAVTARASECAGDGIEVTVNATTEHRDLQVAALSAIPAQYSSAVISNGSIVPLLSAGLLRPLDDLVAKHGSALKENQLITMDGKIMAIAFAANAQHLFYRSDILEKAGVGVPSTYEDVLVAAEAIRKAGLMEYPVALNTKTGWNLGEEFVNMYMGTGAAMFKPGSAEVAVNNDHGVATLNMLKALWEAGDLTIANLWGTRAAPILDAEGSTEAITSTTVLAAAPTWGGGEKPASTLWWDGFTISKNASDVDAEATFIAMMNGISTDMVKANNDLGTWLIEGYVPGVTAEGVAATAMGGASPYPMLPFMGTLHGALGAELSDFLQGNESAEQALADVEAAYTAAATEKGFLK